MKYFPSYLWVLGNLGIQPADTHNHTQMHVRSIIKDFQHIVSVHSKHTHPYKHTNRGAHRLISLGKQLHSLPTGKGSYSVGGPEAISITNRKVGLRTENQKEMRMNLRNQSRDRMLTTLLALPVWKIDRERSHIYLAPSASVPRDRRGTIRAFLFRESVVWASTPMLRCSYTTSPYKKVAQ